VTLTFDDGPDPVWTSRLLDLLAAAAAEATFFPIAPRAVAHPDLIARMRAEGHGIGVHCNEHVRHSSQTGAWVVGDTVCALGRLADLIDGVIVPRTTVSVPERGGKMLARRSGTPRGSSTSRVRLASRWRSWHDRARARRRAPAR
jgi:peptidoglycan/xylan/chitin deacetylase (PgdA/CDA1 family)